MGPREISAPTFHPYRRAEPDASVKYSVVIPVYGSGAWLEEMVDRIHAVLSPLGEPFELIFVNDASPDELTWRKIEDLAARHPWIHAYDMLYNVGQFVAIVCGLEHARGAFILTMDDDLQHPPEELPKLIEAIRDDPDVVCVTGVYETKRHSWLRNAGSELYSLILKQLYGKPEAIKTSSFRIMRRELAEAITRYRSARPLLGSMTVELTRRIKNVPVAHHPRARGRSGYRVRQLMGRTLDAVIYKSTAPLRAFSILGFGTAMVAFLVGVFVFVQWLLGDIGVPGYTSLILTIAFFSGTILMGIGIVGEYIARIIGELSGPARYHIRRTASAQGVQNSR
jgi:polyisoprenyl-phosphate glycosyltransferase